MSDRDAYAEESRMKQVVHAILELPKRITEPSKSITDEGERR